jgi:hypothetical protein
MIIIGVDFHPAYQEIASVNTETGEYQEKRLAHAQEAEEFYRCLACVGQTVRVGMEASGQAQWLERLLEGLGSGVVEGRCGGDPSETRTQTEDRSRGCSAYSQALVEG